MRTDCRPGSPSPKQLGGAAAAVERADESGRIVLGHTAADRGHAGTAAMSFRSALYVGAVMHRRLRPTVHQFRYRAFWLLIDLDELPGLTARLRLFSHNRFNLFALARRRPGRRQRDAASRSRPNGFLSEAGIDIAGGAIRLLCMPRTLGYSFNPISIYYCHRPGGALAAIIYEVHNTFGERHSTSPPSSTRFRRDPAKLPQGLLRISVHGYGPGLPLPADRSRGARRRRHRRQQRRRTRSQCLPRRAGAGN